MRRKKVKVSVQYRTALSHFLPCAIGGNGCMSLKLEHGRQTSGVDILRKELKNIWTFLRCPRAEFIVFW